MQGQIHLAGVSEGSTLFIMAHLAEIIESLNTSRQIVGFDIFDDYNEKYPLVCEQDGDYYDHTNQMPHCVAYSKLVEHVKCFNSSIRLDNFERIKLVKGNVVDTYPKFISSESPLISALFMHIETFSADKAILESAWPNLGKGSIIVSSTLGNFNSPGVLRAVQEKVDIGKIRIMRSQFTSKMCYFVKD